MDVQGVCAVHANKTIIIMQTKNRKRNGTDKNRRQAYIEEQNNYNCQQFFGDVSNCTFAMSDKLVRKPRKMQNTPAH